ncbi:hypothetical protein SAMN03080617_00680 [Algoriphagus alkaliphilus]|uniref:Uncharacterized protein n=1 Tax=Algoriphagus alkaliphilus TaxID=279824 RepID=A0A1G5VSL6_9BACT|nr:hypothetical protein SAMN03080617_00680 [Algoriphagus alkaliphilus]
MGEAYQIRDQEMPYFLTFQVVGWADVFTRKIYRDFILENLTLFPKREGIVFVWLCNHEQSHSSGCSAKGWKIIGLGTRF